MPWRTSPDKKLEQFFVGLRVPFHVNQARKKRGLPSRSAYYRELIIEDLQRTLGMDPDEVRSWMPKTWDEAPGAVKVGRQDDEVDQVNQVDKVG